MGCLIVKKKIKKQKSFMSKKPSIAKKRSIPTLPSLDPTAIKKAHKLLEVINESPGREYKFDYEEAHKLHKTEVKRMPFNLNLQETMRIKIKDVEKFLDMLKEKNVLDTLAALNNTIDLYFLNFVVTEKIVVFPYILNEIQRNTYVFSFFLMFFVAENKEMKYNLIENFLLESLANTPKNGKPLALKRVVNDLVHLFFAVYLMRQFSEETEAFSTSSKELNTVVKGVIEKINDCKKILIETKKLSCLLDHDYEESGECLRKICEVLANKFEPNFYELL